ncbi:MAG: tetraacyldisaccharide 4'-kinase [Candidatus Zixiibacteriota bacterium]
MFEQYWKKILRRKGLTLLAVPALLLWLASFLYRLLFAVKKASTGEKIKIATPLICIGNITVGGTGKTSMVAFIARFLLDEGYHVGVVSSGYGRDIKTSFIQPGYKVQNMATSETGDEVKLLANHLPQAIFSVGKIKTIAAQRLAENENVDIIIVDDGFQHFKLYRDIDIVTYDAGIHRKMIKLFPCGVLREPLSSLKRADIIIITRSNFARDLSLLQNKLRKINGEAKHYHAQFSANELISNNRTLPVKYLEDKSVFLFAGIGNFRALKRQVVALCADLDYALELADHQRYDNKLLHKIKALAEKFDSDLILTTEKDWVKIEDFDFGRQIYYLNQTIDLDPGEEKLINYIQKKLQLRKQAN